MRTDNRFGGPILFVLVQAALFLAWIPAWPQTQIVRGPYLQRSTDSGISVLWRTDVATDSRVLCGAAPDALAPCAELAGSRTDHVVPLTGLDPDTLYFYAVGSSTELLAGGDTEHSFVTHPLPGTLKPTRIWVLGDSGNGNQFAMDVRDAYYAFDPGRRTDVWLHLGDVSQMQGTDAQYQLQLFDIYAEMLRKSVLWPTQGNHDGVNSDWSTESGPYYEMFTLPTAAEAGGLASGTEAYYSFDYSNIHFVILNSLINSVPQSGVMFDWLEQDLAATSQDWIIAYWHHPPYSKGFHDSDDPADSSGRLVFMRENALPILEDHGVDLVLSGHSHSYERSYMIDGHYGYSSEFGSCDDAGTPGVPGDDFCANSPGLACPGGMLDCDLGGFLVDAGDGLVGGDGPYEKPLLGPQAHEGAVYAVAGSSGTLNPGSFDHPAILVHFLSLGSMVLDVDAERLDARFLDSTGAVLDEFTIIKGVACPSGPYLDADEDGLCDDLDNCPNEANPGQENADGDALGDACDSCPHDPANDGDGDGVCGDVDNCPSISNLDQADGDGDGTGDACDACPGDPYNDADGDAVCGDVDNCPDVANPDQLDTDADGPGDACDPCPFDPLDDADHDGWCADVDNCPEDSNPCQVDSDGNGVGDVCDISSTAACDTFVQQDSWLKQSAPGKNYGGDDELSSQQFPSNARRAMFQFDLSTVPAGATVLSATAWFYVTLEDESGQQVDVHRITAEWEERQVTWETTSSSFESPAVGSIVPSTNEEWVSLDLTSLAQDWVGGTIPNHGVMFLSSSWNLRSRYASKEWSVSAQRPCLDVVYQCLAPDHDTDGDGVPDVSDGCPNDPEKTEPGLCGCGWPEIDPDFDQRCSTVDNCPLVANYDQADADDDGAGDVCDTCPLDPRDDADGDAVCADADNCPTVSNASQADADADGQGDACDLCPLDLDDDLDGDLICGNLDNCPAHANPTQEDSDEDGVGDACEASGDADGDGVPNLSDNCVWTSNPAQRDADADGLGDACDPDDDDDGVGDEFDCAPLAPAVVQVPGAVGGTLVLKDETQGTRLAWIRPIQGLVSHVYRGELIAGTGWHGDLACIDFANPGTESVQADNPGPGRMFYYVVGSENLCGAGPLAQGSLATPRVPTYPCPVGSQDSDGDGHPDRQDSCPLASNADLSDVDGDFVGDVCDNCPTVANADQADLDADGRGDLCEHLLDGDNDGIEDPVDNCPATANTNQQDADEDGLGDVCDPCPDDPGNSTVDSDDDGVPDCTDDCPFDPDNDADGDGVCGDIDNCPVVPNSCQIDTDGDGLGNLCDTFGPESCNVFVDRDAWLEQASPSKNNGSDKELESKEEHGDSMRPVYHYDLTGIPEGLALVSARAWFYVTGEDESGQAVQVHRMTDDWTESGVNWVNSASDFDPLVEALFTPTAEDVGIVLDLTVLVQDWVDGKWPNHGLMFLSALAGEKSKYASKEWQNQEGSPCLEVIPQCVP